MNKQMLEKIKHRIAMLKFIQMLKPRNEKEKILSNELLKNFQGISFINTKDLSGAALTWALNMNRLKELVLKNDPRNFLQWDIIRKTMFVNNSSYISTELEFLKNSGYFNEYWQKGIIENKAGSPSRYNRYKISSENLIHLAYHLQQFEERTNLKINKIDFVFEFGGGFGCMYRLFKNLGYDNKYVIFDLQSFSSLQKYYLKSLGYRLLTVEEFCHEKSGILCISDWEELKVVINASLSLERKLFIGTWSISETPIDLRNAIFPLINKFNLFLLAYQEKFGEVDNIRFFNDFQKKYSNIKWENWEINHIPGNYYLIGNGL